MSKITLFSIASCLNKRLTWFTGPLALLRMVLSFFHLLGVQFKAITKSNLCATATWWNTTEYNITLHAQDVTALLCILDWIITVTGLEHLTVLARENHNQGQSRSHESTIVVGKSTTASLLKHLFAFLALYVAAFHMPIAEALLLAYIYIYMCVYIYIYMSCRTAKLQTLPFKYLLNKLLTEYFKHAAHSPFFFSLQDAVYFIMLSFLVPVIFTF